MILTGLDPAPVTYRLAYTDPGVTSRDFYNTLLPTYIMSINTTSFSELTKRLVSTGTTLLTTADTSGLAIGTYNITYKTTDSDLLSKTIIRKLKVELNTQPPTMIIFGDTRVNLVIGVNYGDPGVLSKTVYDETIITYIYSIDGVLKTNLRVKSTGNIEDYTFSSITELYESFISNRIENSETLNKKYEIKFNSEVTKYLFSTLDDKKEYNNEKISNISQIVNSLKTYFQELFLFYHL